jgi:signal recognition particle receptor subunit beta
MTDILKADVDVVTFVVSAEAPESFEEAAEMLVLVMTGLEAPIVIAVNRCDNHDRAREVAAAIGADEAIQVIPCQLVDPASGREVIAEVLVALLQSSEYELMSQGVQQ